MTTGIVIGYKGTPQERWENWLMMLCYKQGSIELRNNPDTKSIAIDDEKRYNKELINYVSPASQDAVERKAA
jgi:hypothetical protein